jgi:hypothetical protein
MLLRSNLNKTIISFNGIIVAAPCRVKAVNLPGA